MSVAPRNPPGVENAPDAHNQVVGCAAVGRCRCARAGARGHALQQSPYNESMSPQLLAHGQAQPPRHLCHKTFTMNISTTDAYEMGETNVALRAALVIQLFGAFGYAEPLTQQTLQTIDIKFVGGCCCYRMEVSLYNCVVSVRVRRAYRKYFGLGPGAPIRACTGGWPELVGIAEAHVAFGWHHAQWFVISGALGQRGGDWEKKMMLMTVVTMKDVAREVLPSTKSEFEVCTCQVTSRGSMQTRLRGHSPAQRALGGMSSVAMCR